MSTRGAHSLVRKTATGLPRLDEERLVVAEAAQLADDRVERLPAPRGAAGAAVDDEVVRVLGDLRVEVVHEHPQHGLLLPAAGRERGAARGADGARAGGGGAGGLGAHGRESTPRAGATGRCRAAVGARYGPQAAISCSPNRRSPSEKAETISAALLDPGVVGAQAAGAGRRCRRSARRAPPPRCRRRRRPGRRRPRRRSRASRGRRPRCRRPGSSRATTADARSSPSTTTPNAAASTLAAKAGSAAASANACGSCATATPPTSAGRTASRDGSSTTSPAGRAGVRRAGRAVAAGGG